MTLGEFLDAAYAIQVREATRMGVPLLDAIAKMEGHAQQEVRSRRRRVTPQEAANTAALSQLQRMMTGVKVG